MVPNTVEICTTAPLQYLLINMKEVELEKVSPLLVICKFLRLFVNFMTADDKYSLLNRDNLIQHIQMQLSKKQKNFLSINFFLHFLNVD